MTATDDAPAAGVDPQKLAEWRAAGLDTLGVELSDVTLATFRDTGVTTRGQAFDLLYSPDAPAVLMELPYNLTETQVGDLGTALDASLEENGIDPAALAVGVPAAVEADAVDLKALADYDQETARLVMDMNRRLLSLEIDWEHKHGEAAIAKKEYETARDKMLVFIRERQDNRGRPTLFDGIPLHDADPTAPDPLADLWQSFPIEAERWEKWGLTAKDVEKLNQGETKNHGTHPMATLGDVTRFVTPNPANPAYARTLKDVKGMGDKGFDRWTEAETKFWAWWNNGGKAAFAAELGVTPDASQPGAGAEHGQGGGDGDAQTGTLPGLEGATQDRNPLPDATAEPRKRKGRAK